MVSNKAIFSALLFSIFATPVMALNIFTCQPDWAALVKVHAPQANIFSATTAYQDPHFIQARPSLIAQMRKADLVICSGAEQEIGWLPELQRQSRNSKVRTGSEGLFYVTDYVAMLDKRDNVDRVLGDVHAQGNPHVQFAISDMLAVSKALTLRLTSQDKKNASQYQKNGVKFQQQWQQSMLEWQQKAAPLKGKKVVGYHGTYRYLFAWLGIEQVADLEPKPGVSPTTAHLNSLANFNAQQVYAIVYSTHQSDKAANWLAKRTALPVVALAQSVGGTDQALDIFSLIDSSIDALLAVQP
ncbi:zinc ABC transporter substrate-binding protein [Psychromonas sp. Urea-02u-13]|uniref:metal ABC transporter solute-binding protein, Zn/Mn family n=1 Tax=Psychromonas sp. Urea-02u-13 TaxID=2058326 RepID=UPI000C329C8F|nr:zinc ABC transporter substrate-binding protein [Psychromonas sp. Urea-02u-13]PKG37184.1 zinc ABC transporter substrate-binding protein [Psychromonas sp. Urea-02u-13]